MFKIVPDYEFAKVDLEGNIKSFLTNSLYMPHTDKDGYLRCKVWDGTKNRGIFIHRAIAKAFIPNPLNHPVVNHIDCNKKNNNVGNLEWCTVKHNTRHAMRAGLVGFTGEDSPVSKYTEKQVHEVCNLLQQEVKIPEIVVATGVKRNTVFDIKAKRTWLKISNQYSIPEVKKR